MCSECGEEEGELVDEMEWHWMAKPVCMKCLRFYRCVRNGVYWTEGKPVGEDWVPYKVWHSDKWRCEGCGGEILIGHGGDAVRHDYEAGFAEFRRASEADKVNVNDC